MVIRFRLRALLIVWGLISLLVASCGFLIGLVGVSYWRGHYSAVLHFNDDDRVNRSIESVAFITLLDMDDAKRVLRQCRLADPEKNAAGHGFIDARLSESRAVLEIPFHGKSNWLVGTDIAYTEPDAVVLRIQWDDETVEYYVVELPRRLNQGVEIALSNIRKKALVKQ